MWLDIFSLPAQIVTAESPIAIDFAPWMSVSKPEPHSLLIVRAGEACGTPDC